MILGDAWCYKRPMLIRFLERHPPSIPIICAVVAITTFAWGPIPTTFVLAGLVLHRLCEWIDHY